MTKACVDTTTLESGKVATVILEKGNEEFILCNLNGPSNYDSNMDLAFVAGEKICFKTEVSWRVAVQNLPTTYIMSFNKF